MPSRTRPRSKYNSLPHGSPAQRSARDLFATAVNHHLPNELGSAEQGYRGAIALEPRFAEALNNLGALLRPRDVGAAHALFERAVAARPKYVEALFNLGLSHMERGELLRSGELFRSILEIDP